MDHKSFFLFDFCLIARYSLRLSIFFSFFPLSSSSLANRRTFPPLIPFAHHFKSTLLFLHTLARKKVVRIVYLLFHLRFFAPLSLFSFLSTSLYSRSLQTARRLLLIHWWWDKAAVGCTFSKLSARFSSSSDAQPPVFLSSQPLPGINSSILNPIPNPDYPVSFGNVSTLTMMPPFYSILETHAEFSVVASKRGPSPCFSSATATPRPSARTGDAS